MSDTIVLDTGGIVRVLDLLASDFPQIAEDALASAFVDGGVLEDIWRRTPKSARAKYAEKEGIRISRKGALQRGWRDMVDADTAERLDTYGTQRLANSLLPGQGDTPLDMLGFKRTSDGMEFRIASSLDYAGRIHETDHPAEGDYWTPGARGGWSTPGTGSKYIERVVDPARIGKALADRATARMRA